MEIPLLRRSLVRKSESILEYIHLGVTILTICSSWGVNIDNIVTPLLHLETFVSSIKKKCLLRPGFELGTTSTQAEDTTITPRLLL